MNSAFFDKLIDRLDKLDPESLQLQFLRLTREKGLLEAVFNALHEGIVVLDGGGLLTYANQAASQLLGLPPTAVNQPMARILKDIDWEQILHLDQPDRSELISRELEVTYPARRILHLYAMPMDLGAGQRRGAVVILRDITGEREQARRVLTSERLTALMVLAAGVAHEIGNPLNSLDIHLQLVERELRGLPDPAGASCLALAATARKEVKRLNLIVTQFLNAIRPSQPRREPTAVDDLVRETVAFMKHEIENRDVLVRVECPDPVPRLSLDPNQIKQVCFNIIKNALRAMTRGGMLTITVFSNDQALGVRFKDTGRGFAPEDLARLFEPFRSSNVGGTGLGLMLVQRIVQDHGGRIEVHSQPGSGTTVTMLLPLDTRRVRLLKAPRPTRSRRPRPRTAPGEPVP